MTIDTYVERMTAGIVAQYSVDVNNNNMTHVEATIAMSNRFSKVGINVARMIKNGEKFSETKTADEYLNEIINESTK